MNDEEIRQAIIKATAATFRQVSLWGQVGADELREVAEQVEYGDVDNWLACPACEEIECDADCPLLPVRSGGDHVG